MENKIIEKFLRRNHIVSLAVTDDLGVWCANLFYVYQNGELIFFSSADSRHIKAGQANPRVGCSIATKSNIIARLQGVQIEGVLHAAAQEIYRPIFLKKFPVAALWNQDMWVVKISSIKYTDNTLGFGTKLYWNRDITGA